MTTVNLAVRVRAPSDEWTARELTPHPRRDRTDRPTQRPLSAIDPSIAGAVDVWDTAECDVSVFDVNSGATRSIEHFDVEGVEAFVFLLE